MATIHRSKYWLYICIHIYKFKVGQGLDGFKLNWSRIGWSNDFQVSFTLFIFILKLLVWCRTQILKTTAMKAEKTFPCYEKKLLRKYLSTSKLKKISRN